MAAVVVVISRVLCEHCELDRRCSLSTLQECARTSRCGRGKDDLDQASSSDDRSGLCICAGSQARVPTQVDSDPCPATTTASDTAHATGCDTSSTSPYHPTSLVDTSIKPCQASVPPRLPGLRCRLLMRTVLQRWRLVVGPRHSVASVCPRRIRRPRRTAHVPQYRLRVDDVIEFVYRLTREETAAPYELNVGDAIQVESFTDEKLNRDLLVQPDGTITLPLLGQVRATRRTVDAAARRSRSRVHQVLQSPGDHGHAAARSTRKLEDLRATVDSRAGSGGQRSQARVTPDGTIALPAIGVGARPGTDARRTEARNRRALCQSPTIEGIEVTPVLLERAPRYVYVLGEVNAAGPLSTRRPDDRDAGPRAGRRLERRRQHCGKSSSSAAATIGG